MLKAGFKPGEGRRVEPPDGGDGEAEPDETADLEQLAGDQIAQVIIAKFQGHGMAKLVDAILRAQGYTTHVSPPGPDKGVDILAAPGPLGFGEPRLCVQVKSHDGPVDRPTLDQLVGAMKKVNADQRLLVSWGGFKQTVYQELPRQFFHVCLWEQAALIGELQAHHDRLDAEIKADLPLKQSWALAVQDEGERDRLAASGTL